MDDHDIGPDPTRPSRDERERARAERTTARRRLLEVEPGNANDLDAAAACECSCHPRPGQIDKHGAEACSCQWTDHDRATHFAEFHRMIEQQRPEIEALERDNARALADAAAALEVDATEKVPAAPWVIVGRVDGRRFYLRERWEAYTIVISPADDPDLDVWRSEQGVLVHSGDATDLLTAGRVDYSRALRVVAGAVRTYLRREVCAHPHDDEDRFCSACGQALRDLASPTGDDLDGLAHIGDAQGWRSSSHLRAIGVALDTWRRAGDELRAAVRRAREAGEPWSAIALMLDVDARDAVRQYGDEVP